MEKFDTLLKSDEFSSPSPENGRICYVDDNICVDRQKRRMEINPKWYIVLIIAALIIGGVIGIQIIQYEFFGYRPLSIERFFSISFVSGLLALLAVIFNIKMLRAIVIGIMPVMFCFPLILLGLNAYYGELSTEYVIHSLINHSPHFVLFILILIQRQHTSHKEMIVSAIFWFAEISIVYIIFPDYKTLYYLPYLPALLIIMASIGIAWLILYLSERKKDDLVSP